MNERKNNRTTKYLVYGFYDSLDQETKKEWINYNLKTKGKGFQFYLSTTN